MTPDLMAFSFDGSLEDRRAYNRALRDLTIQCGGEMRLAPGPEIESCYVRGLMPREALQHIVTDRGGNTENMR